MGASVDAATLGARCEAGGVAFRVWAPERMRVELVVEAPRPSTHALARGAAGLFEAFVPGLGPGALYRYRLDGQGPFPDPASRFQPQGVHGPSEVIDPGAFAWTDGAWRGIGLEELVVYELHIGAFSEAGTFLGVEEKLDHLAGLGVTALELMPVADFPGRWNWGYDGAALFAPARCYGRPEALRRLVDRAHAKGLAVLLDVVYNHFGPDGAYAAAFSDRYLSESHTTPWGRAINLDGADSAQARAFFVENALHWIHEYHLDGLRLDATHALVDESPRHFLAELAARVRSTVAGRQVLLVAEDHRNLATLVRPVAAGGWGLDAVWTDDFHHQVRRLLAGDSEGYYRDYAGTTQDLAATLGRGFFFTGQHSEHFGAPRGTDPAGLRPRQFVVALQNHDQIGNRAFGERLHHQIEAAAWRAASALLLLAPQTPLLFMGQEWAAPEPFLFFTDHGLELGRLVTEGRRREFRGFSAFTDPRTRERIPDPQDARTFEKSRLDWSALEREAHAATLRLYRTLLRLRRSEPLLSRADWKGFEALACGEDGLLLLRAAGRARLLVLARLRGAGALPLPAQIAGKAGWEVVLTTEDASFAPGPAPMRLDLDRAAPSVDFARPGAVVLRGR
jgi:maltooligosyltrehalose trehalohydrolase